MIYDVSSDFSPATAGGVRSSIPILALDVPTLRDALAVAQRVPRADFVKVGLQLYTAEGPDAVRALQELGRRVFLDLKFHDIPNTVAGAVESAARLGVELLTLHASGGRRMLEAARDAIGAESGPQLLAVTMLTSLSGPELEEVWGRRELHPEDEVVRLAELATETRMDGVVASVHEVPAIRARTGTRLRVLTPGIRLSGDTAGDQSRVATPGAAVRAGADYLVIGRSVTGAPEPAAAFDRLLQELRHEGPGEARE